MIGCVYSPPGLVIFEAVEGTFVHFTKGHDHFISNSIRCGCLRQDQCNIAFLRSCVQKCTGNIGRRHSVRRQRIAPFDLQRASLPPSLFAIMFSDTLYSKEWYDMPHIGCGIHSLQRSTISRIGRHSAGHYIDMRVVLYKL